MPSNPIEPVRTSSRIRSKIETNRHKTVSCRNIEDDGSGSEDKRSEDSFRSYNKVDWSLNVDPANSPYLGGIQPPAVPPWYDAGTPSRWVPRWWNDEDSPECKEALIDKKSLNEWDYLEAPWSYKHQSKMIGRKRFTTAQLQILEVGWSINQAPVKVERQRLAMWMGTRTKHVNIWYQNRRQHDKKVRLSGDNPETAFMSVEGLVAPMPAMKSIVRKILIGELSAATYLSMSTAAVQTASDRSRSAKRLTHHSKASRHSSASPYNDNSRSDSCNGHKSTIVIEPSMSFDNLRHDGDVLGPTGTPNYSCPGNRHTSEPPNKAHYMHTAHKRLSISQSKSVFGLKNPSPLYQSRSRTHSVRTQTDCFKTAAPPNSDDTSPCHKHLHDYSPLSHSTQSTSLRVHSPPTSSSSDSDWSGTTPRSALDGEDDLVVCATSTATNMDSLSRAQIVYPRPSKAYKQTMSVDNEVLDAADILIKMQARRYIE